MAARIEEMRKDSMIHEQEARKILETALKSGAEFAELFFEDREESNMKCVKEEVQGLKTVRIFGAGLYVISGTSSIYVYSNDCSYEGLLHLAKQASEMINLKRKEQIRIPDRFQGPVMSNPNPVKIYPATVEGRKKQKVLRETAKAALFAGPEILSLNTDYFDTDQRIWVINSEGLSVKDRRVTTRLRLQVAVSDGRQSFYNWEDYTHPSGFEVYEREQGYTEFARDMVKRTRQMMDGVAVPPSNVPVVLEAGSCGTLWHESCGHSLEACAIAAKNSAFVGKLGQKVASEKVTLIDDGTIPGLYGSSVIDDEGHVRQKNILIENGILKSYLCDRFHGSMIGMKSNGCGRRQNYTYAPTARMSNTYLAPGEDDEEEMIRSVPEGLYVKSIGGGTGGMQFSLEVKEGWWIKNGELAYPVKGLMLTGNGLDVIRKIDRVGKRLEYDGGGFCGAASGLIPTTTFQPRVRIAEMAIGG